MITIDNKEYRNLTEQVLKNANDIVGIKEGEELLSRFGIRVIGQVDTAAELPDPSEYLGQYGDAILVGTTNPYDYYIFTRPFTVGETSQWFDIGEFPLPGPTGPQGPQGPKGDDGVGSKIYVGNLSLPQDYVADPKMNDIYINSTNGYLYQYLGNWSLQGSIRGANGVNGTNGTQFLTGTTAPSSSFPTGVNVNDLYLDTTTKILYKNTGGSWSVQTTLGSTGVSKQEITNGNLLSLLPLIGINTNAYSTDPSTKCKIYINVVQGNTISGSGQINGPTLYFRSSTEGYSSSPYMNVYEFAISGGGVYTREQYVDGTYVDDGTYSNIESLGDYDMSAQWIELVSFS